MSAETVVRHFEFDSQFRKDFGVQYAELAVVPVSPDEFLKRSSRAQRFMSQYWEHGGLAFAKFLDDGDNRERLKSGLDWSQETFDLKDREISELIGGKMPVQTARQGLNIGSEVDINRGVRRFTKEELMRLLVGAFACQIAMGIVFRNGQAGVVSDFRRRNPRF